MLSPRISADAVVADKICADEKRLRDSFRFRLFRVFEPDPELRAVAKEIAEHRQILRGRDNENLAQTAEHERGQRDSKSSACRKPAGVVCRRFWSADRAAFRRRRRGGWLSYSWARDQPINCCDHFSQRPLDFVVDDAGAATGGRREQFLNSSAVAPKPAAPQSPRSSSRQQPFQKIATEQGARTGRVHVTDLVLAETFCARSERREPVQKNAEGARCLWLAQIDSSS